MTCGHINLQIRKLSKTYSNGVQALKDVTLTIPPGIYGLLGPNGAGKSTLMRTIATLQEPDEGTIHLGDLDVVKQKDEMRKTLGYLPQEFGVYARSTVEELLRHFAMLEGITSRRARNEVVEALLRQTNLWDVRKNKLGSYSGGMRQRFGIAVALLGDPKLIHRRRADGGADDWVEVGVFAPAEGQGLGEPLHLEKHRVRSGEQSITVTVPRKPARAGIDPYHLLIERDREDNTEEVEASPFR